MNDPAFKLLSNKPILDLPEHYGFGDDNEAKYYVSFAQHIWTNTKGAIEWLRKLSAKPCQLFDYLTIFRVI